MERGRPTANTLPSAARYAQSSGSSAPAPIYTASPSFAKERRRSLSTSSNDSDDHESRRRRRLPTSSDDERSQGVLQSDDASRPTNGSLVRPATGFRFGESNLRTKLSQESLQSSGGFARFSSNTGGFLGASSAGGFGSASSAITTAREASLIARTESPKLSANHLETPAQVTPAAHGTPILPTKLRIVTSSTTTTESAPEQTFSKHRSTEERQEGQPQATVGREVSHPLSSSGESGGRAGAVQPSETSTDSQGTSSVRGSTVMCISSASSGVQDTVMSTADTDRVADVLLPKSPYIDSVAAPVEATHTFTSPAQETNALSESGATLVIANSNEAANSVGDTTNGPPSYPRPVEITSGQCQHPLATTNILNVPPLDMSAPTSSAGTVVSNVIDPSLITSKVGAGRAKSGKQKGKKQTEKKSGDKPRKRGEWRVQNYNKTATYSGAPGYYYSGPHDAAFQVSLSGPAPGYSAGMDLAMPAAPTTLPESQSNVTPGTRSITNRVTPSASADGSRTVSPVSAGGAVRGRSAPQMHSMKNHSETLVTPNTIVDDPANWSDIDNNFYMSIDGPPTTGGLTNTESRPISPSKPKTPQKVRRNEAQERDTRNSPAMHVRLANVPRNAGSNVKEGSSRKSFTVNTDSSIGADISQFVPDSSLRPLRPKNDAPGGRVGSAPQAAQGDGTVNAPAPSKARRIEAAKALTSLQQSEHVDVQSSGHQTGVQEGKSRSHQLITAIIEDKRPIENEEWIVELSLSLKSLDVTSGWCADAQQICSTLQSGPSRIDGPAKVHTLRGRFKQYILRVSADNTDNFVSANVHIPHDLLLHLIVEPLIAPSPQITTSNSNVASVSRSKPTRPARVGKDATKYHPSPDGIGISSSSSRRDTRNSSFRANDEHEYSEDETPSVPSKRKAH